MMSNTFGGFPYCGTSSYSFTRSDLKVLAALSLAGESCSPDQLAQSIAAFLVSRTGNGVLVYLVNLNLRDANELLLCYPSLSL